MEFALAIHKYPESCYGVTAPSVPGVFSAGDTIHEAIANAKKAIFLTSRRSSRTARKSRLVTSRSIEELIVDPDIADAIWAYVEVDLSKLDSRPERINISLPRFVLHKIDSYVDARHGTRSGFLARVALEAIANG